MVGHLMENEFNQKHLALMLEKINLYKQNKIKLRILIDDLESLLNILNNMHDKWVDQFLSLWGELEIIYSLNLVENKKIEIDDKNKINNILIKLEKLIQNTTSSKQL